MGVFPLCSRCVPALLPPALLPPSVGRSWTQLDAVGRMVARPQSYRVPVVFPLCSRCVPALLPLGCPTSKLPCSRCVPVVFPPSCHDPIIHVWGRRRYNFSLRKTDRLNCDLPAVCGL